MDNKSEIVNLFSKYCSKCDGQCCKRGVFSVFEKEHQKLASEHKQKYITRIKEQRGTSHDICIDKLCVFSSGHGCTLPVKTRPTDCLTYPFYPKMDSVNSSGEITKFVIDKECMFSKEIAEDKLLYHAVRKYWKKVIKSTTNQEITDWLGKDGNWSDWYKNAQDLKH